MIIGFTSLIVLLACLLVVLLVLLRERVSECIRRIVICLPHSKIYLLSFCYIDDGWCGVHKAFVFTAVARFFYSSSIRFCTEFSVHCVVAQSLTFSTINCILICIRILWNGLVSCYFIILFCESV